VASLAPGPTQAQEVNLFQNLMTDYTRVHLNNLLIESAAPTQPKATQAPAKPAASAAAASTGALVYRPSVAVRHAHLARLAARMRTSDPAAAAELEALNAKGGLFGQLDAALAPMGLKSTDIGDAFSVYLMNAWLAARGRLDTPGLPIVGAVKAQVAQALLATPAIAAAPDKVKQEFAEAMLIQAAYIDAALQQAAGQPERLRAVGRAAREGAAALAIDLDRIELTPEGFRASR
jgi:hypothetical protein